MAEQQTVKITDGKTLGSFLGAVFEEGLKSSLAQKALTEKEKQTKTVHAIKGGGDAPEGEEGGDTGDGVDSLFGGSGGEPEGGGEGGDGAEDAETNMPDDVHNDDDDVEQPDDTDQKLKSGEVSVKDIVEKLNSIRSGKSFKDSAVAKAIDDYVAKLKKPERVACLSFLQGISQIVTGEVPGQAAVSPDSQPADVDMQKGNAPKTVQKKPNVIKGPGETSKAAPMPAKQSSMKPGQEPEEDTTPPAPIVPKKRAK